MHNDFAIDSQILPAYAIAMEFLKQIYTHHLFYCENNFTNLISKLLLKSWVFMVRWSLSQIDVWTYKFAF